MAKKKFKSKLREKFKAAAKNSGRTLSLGDRTVEEHYKGSRSVTTPKKHSIYDTIKGKINTASDDAKKQAHKVLSGKLKGNVEEAYKGLTGIRHPAQLIPAFRKGRNLNDIIKSIIER